MKLTSRALWAACCAVTLLGPAASSSAASPAAAASRAAGVAGEKHLEGRLADGSTWAVDAPARWNGDLVLFSHGYRSGPDNPGRDASFGPTAEALQARGYAVAQASYARTGWALGTAVNDQLGALAAFRTHVGQPRRTIALGRSMGGLVSSLVAERRNSGVDGVVSSCGLLGGGLNLNNYQLDGAHAVAALLLPGEHVKLTSFRSTQEAADSAARLVDAVERAQKTAQGRARISLAAALFNMPTWSPTVSQQPPTDPATVERAEYEYLLGTIPLVLTRRVDIQTVAGGDSGWNAGVDYARLFARSGRRHDVAALYRAAGVDLAADLTTLTKTARVTADRRAVAWLDRTSQPHGKLRVPVLALHTIADPAAPVEYLANYRARVHAAGAGPLLREAYVKRPGHCTFTVAENVAAVEAVRHRITTRRWGTAAQPRSLQRAALRTGLGAAAFIPYRPDPFVNDRLGRHRR